MRALFAPSLSTLCLAWLLPQAGQAETVAQLLATASARHGELFRVEYLEGAFVLVGGLNEVWQLTEAGEIAARATVLVDEESLHLQWDTGQGHFLDMGRDLAVTFTGQDLALAHEMMVITTGQLQSGFQELPKGLRFDADGAIKSADGPAFGSWTFQEGEIAITPRTGTPSVISPASLAAAMTKGSPNDG